MGRKPATCAVLYFLKAVYSGWARQIHLPGEPVADLSFAFRQFLESLQAAPTDRRYADDFHIGALEQLQGDEKALAEKLLLERLALKPDDDRVPPALAIVGTARSAGALHTALEDSTDTMRVRIADALAQLDSGFDPTDVLLAALDSDNFVTRLMAAASLAHCDLRRVAGALLKALTDRDASVRVNAFASLEDAYGLAPLVEPPHSPLRAIATLLMADLQNAVQDGAQRMRAIVSGLEGGDSPETLGIAALPSNDGPLIERVFASLATTEAPFHQDLDIEAIAELEGPSHHYVESVLMAALQDNDPRIPRALATMRSQRALPVLQEALGRANNHARGELEAAIKSLS
jgi:HEAT repeat protein